MKYLKSFKRYEDFTSPSVLTIFIDFSDFLTFPSFKETKDVSIIQMMSAFCDFQLNLNRLFNNCIKLY